MYPRGGIIHHPTVQFDFTGFDSFMYKVIRKQILNLEQYMFTDQQFDSILSPDLWICLIHGSNSLIVKSLLDPITIGYV